MAFNIIMISVLPFIGWPLAHIIVHHGNRPAHEGSVIYSTLSTCASTSSCFSCPQTNCTCRIVALRTAPIYRTVYNLPNLRRLTASACEMSDAGTPPPTASRLANVIRRNPFMSTNFLYGFLVAMTAGVALWSFNRNSRSPYEEIPFGGSGVSFSSARFAPAGLELTWHIVDRTHRT